MKRKLVFLLTCVFLISLGTLIVIVSNTRADQNVLAQITFFLFSLTTITSLLMLVPMTYHSLKHAQVRADELKRLFRRAILISGVLVGLGIFSALHVLNFLSGLTYVFSLVLIEFFFMARKVEKSYEA